MDVDVVEVGAGFVLTFLDGGGSVEEVVVAILCLLGWVFFSVCFMIECLLAWVFCQLEIGGFHLWE